MNQLSWLVILAVVCGTVFGWNLATHNMPVAYIFGGMSIVAQILAFRIIAKVPTKDDVDLLQKKVDSLVAMIKDKSKAS
jgi:uncharacterized membrane protein AbrB (regulator of aidB expression)